MSAWNLVWLLPLAWVFIGGSVARLVLSIRGRR